MYTFSVRAQSVEEFGLQAVNLVQVERRRIKEGDSDTTSMDGLVPVTRTMPEQTSGRRSEPMEVDALQRYEYEDEGEEGECECAALQENGLKGPCYYCYRQGHIARNCPRKSAGLPKTMNPAGRGVRGGARKDTYGRSGAPRNRSGQFVTAAAAQSNRGGPSRGGYRSMGNRRVNQLVEEEEEEEEDDDGRGDDGNEGEVEEATHFLGEMTL